MGAAKFTLLGRTLDDRGGAEDGLGALHNLARHEAVLHIVLYLLVTMTVSEVDSPLHRAGDSVAIQDSLAVHIARRTPDGLYQCAVAAQETLLVGIQDSHQTHLRQVQTLAQQVDTHQHVEHPHPQVAHNLHTFQRIHIAMDIFTPDTQIDKVGRQFLGHTLGEGGHQHALALADGLLNLIQQVIHLTHGGPHLHHRIQQSRGTYHLLHHYAFGLAQLIVGRRSADIDGLPCEGIKLVVGQRPVVQRRRQPEAILHQRGLAAAVATEHGTYLRHRHMALVHHQQEIVGEIVNQAEGAAAGGTSVEVTTIVLDARAVTQLLNHLHVIVHTLLQPLGLQVLVDAVQVVTPLIHIPLNLQQSLAHVILRGEEIRGGIDHHLVEALESLATDGVKALKTFYLVVPEGDTVAEIGKGGVHVHRVALHAEAPVEELNLIPYILTLKESHQQVVALHTVAHPQRHRAPFELVGVADAVDATHARHHNHIPAAAEQRTRGPEPQLVQLVVDLQILLDIGVGGGDVGLGLVVVVVADEILHRVVGEELSELAV